MNFLAGNFPLDPDEGKAFVPEDIQESIRNLIRWAGDDPDREGLADTPKRVARAWREYCQGYDQDPGMHLSQTFEEVVEATDEESGDNFKILIDPKAVMFLLGTRMEYKEDKFKSGFEFVNPNEKGRCGCGESFTV